MEGFVFFGDSRRERELKTSSWPRRVGACRANWRRDCRADDQADLRLPDALLTQAGKPFRSADTKDSPVALFFGLTNPPDICPTTLLDMSSDVAASESRCDQDDICHRRPRARRGRSAAGISRVIRSALPRNWRRRIFCLESTVLSFMILAVVHGRSIPDYARQLTTARRVRRPSSRPTPSARAEPAGIRAASAADHAKA
jgi:SCO1/SenC